MTACSQGDLEPNVLFRANEVLGGLKSVFSLIGQSRDFREVLNGVRERADRQFPENGLDTPGDLVEIRIRRLTEAGEHERAVKAAVARRHATEGLGEHLLLARALDWEGEARCAGRDYFGAIECFKKCAALYGSLGYHRHSVWITTKIAHANRDAGHLREMREYQLLARARATEIGDDNSVGMFQKKFAVDALERREFEQAIVARTSVEAFRRTGETVTLSQALITLAATYLASNCFHEAGLALQEAQLVDPNPTEEYKTGAEFLARIIAKKGNSRLFYDLLTIEH